MDCGEGSVSNNRESRKIIIAKGKGPIAGESKPKNREKEEGKG